MKYFWKLLRYLKPFWLPALLAPALMVLEVVMDLMQPRMLQLIIDTGIGKHDLSFVLHQTIIMLAIAAVGLIGGAGCSVFSTIAALSFSTSLRDKLFHKLEELSFANLDVLESGGLITRLTNDVDQVQEAVIMLLRMLIRAPLLSIGGLIMAILTAPKLSIILLVIAPIIIFMLIVVNRKAQPQFMLAQKKMDDTNTVMLENLAGVRVVKAFVRAAYESNRFRIVTNQLSEQRIKSLSTVAAVMPAMMLLMSGGIACALWFGGVSVSHGSLKVGELLAFINYLTQMLSSLMMASMALIWLSRAESSAERITEILHSEPTIKDNEDAAEIDRMQAKVEFENVSFAYGKDSDNYVLQNVSFCAQPCETIGILGSTGEGKSTLVHLIPRFYDVTQGRILIDDIDIRRLSQQSLRRHIAMVFQNTTLFSGTIKENIKLGNLDASDSEIEEAAKIAQAHDFIMDFPDGYDTMLEQGGVNLSGGQKQRLAIARAVVKRPAILILDDCTSSVDMTTEARILQELQAWSHRCTRFIIAQRISAVIGADRILVIENGTIAAEGTHSQLIRTSPIYQLIVQSQVTGAEVEDGC